MVKNRKKRVGFFFIIVLVCVCVELVYYNKIELNDEEIATNITSENVSEEHVNNSTIEKAILDTTEETQISSFDVSLILPYEGNPFIKLNNNVPFFTEEEKKSKDMFEIYSDLDQFGRCGMAYANVCVELQPTEERQEIGPIKPSGWHTVKYNDLIDGNYLYNRCHLIGYQLTGENANEKNLITGTRYLNVDGMLDFENQVSDYVKTTKNHVLYRVTPVFEGENLVASGVLIEAWSVEDKGKGICFNVYCYNVQPGISINYATGDSERILPEIVIEDTTDITTEVTNNVECDYVVNKNTKRIHIPSCSSVSDMAEHNKWYYEGNINDLINNGYKPCQRCLAN